MHAAARPAGCWLPAAGFRAHLGPAWMRRRRAPHRGRRHGPPRCWDPGSRGPAAQLAVRGDLAPAGQTRTPDSAPLFLPRDHAVIKDFCKFIGADSKQAQGLVRLAKRNGERLGFLA